MPSHASGICLDADELAAWSPRTTRTLLGASCGTSPRRLRGPRPERNDRSRTGHARRVLSRRAPRHARGGARAQPQPARSTTASWRCSAATPTLTELGRLLRALVRALLLQALEAGAQDASPPPARRSCRARARTPACSGSRTAGPSPSRSSRTTTRRRSSRTRAPPPASAASCATSSPWARARSRCSTASASARSTEPRNRYLFAGVVKGVGDYGNCVGVPTLGGEVDFADGYTGNPLVNAMCVGLLREERPDHGAGARRRQRAPRRRRAHGPRRHPRRQLRLRGALGEERGAAAAGAGRRPVHREAAARGAASS